MTSVHLIIRRNRYYLYNKGDKKFLVQPRQEWHLKNIDFISSFLGELKNQGNQLSSV